MNETKEIINNIKASQNITKDQLQHLLTSSDETAITYLYASAREVADGIYGKDIYIRGLIEFTNICGNDCYYCGIRQSNAHVQRYRLDKDTILACADTGYQLGFRTMVLQGGEDSFFTDERICDIITSIKKAHPDVALTLSIGEKSYDSYLAYREAGADRFLLRHETADAAHYESLHPQQMSYDHRMQCLQDLKSLGFQTGCGFMVGSPGQTVDTLYQDLQFIRRLQPEMVGIGPFIPAAHTPMAGEVAGELGQTLRLLAIIRLLHPSVLLPATTALGTIHPTGREQGILAGANVVMPNLSPQDVRAKYSLYDHKICTGEEAAECLACLAARVEKIGYRIVTDRGDYKKQK